MSNLLALIVIIIKLNQTIIKRRSECLTDLAVKKQAKKTQDIAFHHKNNQIQFGDESF